jgi:hypothetical protein
MDKFLPGLSKISKRVRRAIGLTLLAIIVLTGIVPIITFASVGPACGGGYPKGWCSVPLDSVVDNWGMYNRECVSYTAFRVAQSGRRMPYGFGDANKWPATALAYGISVDSSPRAGDVAIRMDGKHGHSMYVESVNSDGSVGISQYNLHKTGNYSAEVVRPEGLVFIHF